ncbi:hypothetical protein EVG20_g1659 [Dentipellis fragilis]|uniref:Uncharacterized protein n=1 Tax=Dentipellis fragilis TaxID=205917 RepID=A0A4Y9ZB20_9AGAM|nr:hypothetical protein EVG20_g1659 [Dentipellis fragilis]
MRSYAAAVALMMAAPSLAGPVRYARDSAIDVAARQKNGVGRRGSPAHLPSIVNRDTAADASVGDLAAAAPVAAKSSAKASPSAAAPHVPPVAPVPVKSSSLAAAPLPTHTTSKSSGLAIASTAVIASASTPHAVLPSSAKSLATPNPSVSAASLRPPAASGAHTSITGSAQASIPLPSGSISGFGTFRATGAVITSAIPTVSVSIDSVFRGLGPEPAPTTPHHVHPVQRRTHSSYPVGGSPAVASAVTGSVKPAAAGASTAAALSSAVPAKSVAVAASPAAASASAAPVAGKPAPAGKAGTAPANVGKRRRRVNGVPFHARSLDSLD